MFRLAVAPRLVCDRRYAQGAPRIAILLVLQFLRRCTQPFSELGEIERDRSKPRSPFPSPWSSLGVPMGPIFPG